MTNFRAIQANDQYSFRIICDVRSEVPSISFTTYFRDETAALPVWDVYVEGVDAFRFSTRDLEAFLDRVAPLRLAASVGGRDAGELVISVHGEVAFFELGDGGATMRQQIAWRDCRRAFITLLRSWDEVRENARADVDEAMLRLRRAVE